MKERTLPLGIDLGTSRVRVVAVARSAAQGLRLLGMGVADVDGDRADALRRALSQIGTTERLCRVAIPARDARLRAVQFPSMRGAELRRAIRFEGVSMFGPAASEQSIAVRSASFGQETLVAAAPSEKVRDTLGLLRSCGLRPVMIDHEACVLVRGSQLPLLDIGFEGSTFVGSRNGMPYVRSFALGGATFTHALSREYGCTFEIAEIRKRAIGLCGAANDALEAYARALGATLEEAAIAPGAGLFVCGNGARLSALREKIAQNHGVRVLPVTLDAMLASALPAEVESAAAFDWFGAIACALPSDAAHAA